MLAYHLSKNQKYSLRRSRGKSCTQTLPPRSWETVFLPGDLSWTKQNNKPDTFNVPKAVMVKLSSNKSNIKVTRDKRSTKNSIWNIQDKMLTVDIHPIKSGHERIKRQISAPIAHTKKQNFSLWNKNSARINALSLPGYLGALGHTFMLLPCVWLHISVHFIVESVGWLSDNLIVWPLNVVSYRCLV